MWTSVRAPRRWRMKFEPMKPAPPVTKSFTRRSFPTRADEILFVVAGVPGRSSATGNFVGAGFGDEIGGEEEGFESAGIGPPAVQDAVGEGAFLEVHVVDVGNFEFVAPAGLGLADFLEDGGVVEIEAGDGVIGFGGFGLFLDAEDAAIDDFGATKAVGVGNFLENDVGAGGLFFESFLGGDDVVFDDVVAEDDADFFTFDKRFGKTKSIGDAAFAFLIGVMDAVEVEIFAVGEEAEEVAGILTAGDDDDVPDAGIHESLDGIENHGAIKNGQQMLVGDASERIETRAFSTSEDD